MGIRKILHWTKKFCKKKILLKNFFAKIFFSSLNMYQAKSGVKNFSLYWGGGSHVKIFFPVWTCIMPYLVSKIIPFVKNISTRLHPYIHTDRHTYIRHSEDKKLRSGEAARLKTHDAASSGCAKNYWPTDLF